MSKEASDLAFGLEVSSAFFIRAVMYLIGFVGTIVFARILGPTDFGGYYLLLSLVTIAIRPVDGFATAVKKRFSEAGAPRHELLGGQLLAVAVIGATGVLGAFVFQGPLRSYSGLYWAPILFTILLLTVSLSESTMTVIEGTGRVSVSNTVDLLGSVMTFPFQLALVLLGFGAAGMAWGLASASFLAAIIGLGAIGLRPAKPSSDTINSMWSFGRYSIFSSSVSKVLARIDILIIGFFLAPAVAGQYEVALKLSLPAMFISMVASSGLMARVSNFDSKSAKEEIVIDLKNTLSVTGVLAIPMFFGALALRGDIVVTVYGSEYAAASKFLVLLVLYQFVRTQASPVLNTINGLDRPDVNLKITVTTLALNVVLGVGLFFEFGAVAVVVASVLAETFRYAAGSLYLSREVEDIVLLPSTLFKQFVAGVVMFGVVFVANTEFAVDSWYELLVLVGLGASVYGTVLFSISGTQRKIAKSVFEQFRDLADTRF